MKQTYANYYKEWIRRNPEKWRAMQQRSRERNRQKLCAGARRYYEAHREERIAYSKQWRLAHQEKVREWSRKSLAGKRAQKYKQRDPLVQLLTPHAFMGKKYCRLGYETNIPRGNQEG